ncbi:MFS transporter [Evansella clarkii]|uniref:MFS transporter n=1 Tax=Evansella clarkii TaxID=79879 RepID=UPI000B449D35|nr:MFS transporter [Evansella clarkii]
MSLKSLNSTIKIRLFLLFISTMATMSVLPYLIIYFSGQKGPVITGLFFLVVMLANVTGSVLGGYISDRSGRKKIILISEFIVFLGFLGAALANSPWGIYPYLTFLCFVIIQFSTGAGTPVYQALIIDISTPDERKTIYTYSYWVRNAGIAFGSMIGAFMFFSHLFNLFLAVAAATLFVFIITLFFIKETFTPVIETSMQNTRSTTRMFQAYFKILTHRFFTIFSLASLLIVSVEEQLTNYIGVRLANEINEPVPLASFFPLHINGVNLLGILKAENTIIVVSFTILVAYLIRNWNDRYSLMIGLLLFFSGFTVISISTTPIVLIIAMLIVSIGEMMHIPVTQTLLSKVVPDHARSTYMAVYAVAVILGVSTAGVFIIISSWLPPVILTFIIGSMGVVSMILFFNLTRTENFEEPQRSQAL